MYCVHCGAAGAAKFCASCGQSQGSIEQPSEPGAIELNDVSLTVASRAVSDVNPSKELVRDFDWTTSLDYEMILRQAHARDRIAAASRGKGASVTGDDILEVFDAVSPIGFSLGKFTKAILPIYEKLGFKTDRHAQGIYDTQPGRLMLATLCSFAAHALTIDQVHQAPDKCSLSTEIPSSLYTNRGRLSILIENCQTYCQITLTTSISGQWYDWGKSNRLTNNILDAILTDLTDQQRGHRPLFRRVA